MNESVLKGERWREPVLLAVGVWALFYVTNVAFVVTLGFPRTVFLYLAAWAVHGLILTWPLHLLLIRAQKLPAMTRWLIVGLALLPITWAQGWLDAFVAQELSEFRRALRSGPADPVRLLLSRGGEFREIGTEVSLLIYFWVFSAYAVAASLLLAQRRLFDSERRARKAELEALRLQLNPHFLFNALNSVSSLIVTGRHEEAERTTLSLADFLHGALTTPDAGLAPLEQELGTLEAYLQIEAARFGDRLQVEFNVPPELQGLMVPSFVLQPLVENAVKYAVAPANRPVTVQVRAEAQGGQARLIVADDGDPERAAGVRSGTKVGLRTTRERLRALYGDKAGLEVRPGPDGFAAVVTVPHVLAASQTQRGAEPAPGLSRAA